MKSKMRKQVRLAVFALIAFLVSAIVSFMAIRCLGANLANSWIEAQLNKTVLAITKALLCTSVETFAVALIILSVLGTVLSTIYISYMARAIRDAVNTMKKGCEELNQKVSLFAL